MTDRYLAAVDGWEPSERAVSFAAGRAVESDGHLDVAHVVGEDGGDRETNEQIRATVDELLAEFESPPDHDVVFLETKKRPKPATRVGERLLEFVDERNHDQVFVGNEATGTAERMIVGSVAKVLIEDRSVPVTLVP